MPDEVANAVSAEVEAPKVKITVRPNGPFRVEGPISLVDVNGNEWDLTGKPAISLCRCGLSTKRPFCDGTHGKEGWKCDAVQSRPSLSRRVDFSGAAGFLFRGGFVSELIHEIPCIPI
ncbi:MAG: CDGSH iron-sulfur domain-containing protein [Edaphobacter sp.]